MNENGIGEEEYRAFIGKKADYYTKKWSAMDVRQSKWSWNWGAFIFRELWFAYRKMYIFALILFIFLGLIVVVSSIYLQIEDEDMANFVKGVKILYWAIVAVYANYLYHKHADKKIIDFKSTSTGELATSELAKRGGTSLIAPVIFIVFEGILFFI